VKRARLLSTVAVPGLLCAASILLRPADAAAQLGRKSWEFFPHIGAFLPSDPDVISEGVEGMDPGVLWGLYATYHYSDYVGVELGFSKATANGPEADEAASGDVAVPGLGDVGFDFWEVNGFVNSGALNPVQFFATAGGGLVNYDPEDAGAPTRLLLNGGVGVRYYKWKNIALRAELKDFIFVRTRPSDYTGEHPGPGCPVEVLCNFDNSKETIHNVGVFAGLTFNF
jgi:hypothetical protein